MANDDWPDSRERLLKDIEAFDLNGPPKTEEPPQPARFTPAAATSVAASAAPSARPVMAPVAKVAPVAAAVAKPAAPATPATPATPTAASEQGGSNLLATLRMQAVAKLAGEEKKSTQQTELLQRISSALERAFLYLNDLSRQLNILKPPYEKAYSFFGVVDFDEMHWEEGRADFRMQQVSSEDRYYDQVTLRYRLLAPKQFRVTRENPAQEKMRKALFDHNIAFTADEEKNDRARVERATFTFPCEIKAGLLIVGHPETGGMALKMRNIERFGAMEFRMAPEALNAEALDELALLILGKPSRITQLFQRIS